MLLAMTPLETTKPFCYVISPFADDDDKLKEDIDYYYNEVILPVAEPLFHVDRPQANRKPGVIMNKVLKLLVHADLVIADVTRNNSNVMYELGVRHSTGKPTILITWDDPKMVSFDVNQYLIIPVAKGKNGWEKDAIKDLEDSIKSAMNENDGHESPVRKAILERDHIPEGTKVYDWKTTFLPALHIKWLDAVEQSGRHSREELQLIARFRADDPSTYPESQLLLDLAVEFDAYKSFSSKSLSGVMFYEQKKRVRGRKASDTKIPVVGQVFLKFEDFGYQSVSIDGKENQSGAPMLELNFYQREREVRLEDKRVGRIQEFPFQLTFTASTNGLGAYRLTSEQMHPFYSLELGTIELTRR